MLKTPLVDSTIPVLQVRKTYSGKIGGQNDDLAICIQLAITGLRAFYQGEKYANFRPGMY